VVSGGVIDNKILEFGCENYWYICHGNGFGLRDEIQSYSNVAYGLRVFRQGSPPHTCRKIHSIVYPVLYGLGLAVKMWFYFHPAIRVNGWFAGGIQIKRTPNVLPLAHGRIPVTPSHLVNETVMQQMSVSKRASGEGHLVVRSAYLAFWDMDIQPAFWSTVSGGMGMIVKAEQRVSPSHCMAAPGCSRTD